MKVSPTCIKCFATDACVTIRLSGVETSGETEFKCEGCDESFTANDVRSVLKALETGWKKTLAWVDAVPEE